MNEIFTILMTAILSSNIVFSSSLGICSYLGVSKSKSSSIGMGFALVFVTVLATLISYPVGLLLEHFHIEYMSTVCFIMIIASLVQFVEMFIKKFSPSLYKALGVYLPLITTNCVVMDTAIKTTNPGCISFIGGFGGELVYMLLLALGTALGFFLAIYLFSVIREKLEGSPIAKGFQGIAIGLITSALMALIFANAFKGIF